MSLLKHQTTSRNITLQFEDGRLIILSNNEVVLNWADQELLMFWDLVLNGFADMPLEQEDPGMERRVWTAKNIGSLYQQYIDQKEASNDHDH